MKFHMVRWVGDVNGHYYYDIIMPGIEMHLKNGNLPITLLLNSEGGHLQIAKSFIDEMKLRKIPLNTYVTGRVASAAIPICTIGKKRYMDEESHFFFHPLKFWEKEEKRKEANLREWYKNEIAKNTRLAPTEVQGLMDEKRLIGSKEAKKMGLINEIV